ncbi:MAG: tRNA (adenosine(37)-N6)-threonylcarbamoyltransferase complex ATPase subunit type 1 TsaE [Thermoanaerobaculia bacterium]
MRSWKSRGEAHTREIGALLAAELAPDGVLLLTGDLGAGKTVLVQGLAAELGLDPRQVQSPTFTVVREHHGGRRRLVHVDLYRLQPEEAAALGIEEILAGSGIKAVEWAERLPCPVTDGVWLEIRRHGEGRSIRERRID